MEKDCLRDQGSRGRTQTRPIAVGEEKSDSAGEYHTHAIIIQWTGKWYRLQSWAMFFQPAEKTSLLRAFRSGRPNHVPDCYVRSAKALVLHAYRRQVYHDHQRCVLLPLWTSMDGMRILLHYNRLQTTPSYCCWGTIQFRVYSQCNNHE